MEKEHALETFIKANRPSFDDERPSLKVWSAIEKGLMVTEQKNPKLIWRLVAAAILLLLLGAALGILVYPQIQQQQALMAMDEHTELNEMEIFFAKEIEAKLVDLSSTEIENEIRSTLEETDREIKKLKLDLIYAPKSSREEIMQAIIASYETKIHILQTALERVSPINLIENEATIL